MQPNPFCYLGNKSLWLTCAQNGQYFRWFFLSNIFISSFTQIHKQKENKHFPKCTSCRPLSFLRCFFEAFSVISFLSFFVFIQNNSTLKEMEKKRRIQPINCNFSYVFQFRIRHQLDLEAQSSVLNLLLVTIEVYWFCLFVYLLEFLYLAQIPKNSYHFPLGGGTIIDQLLKM